jgi:hypothetical protein
MEDISKEERVLINKYLEELKEHLRNKERYLISETCLQIVRLLK